MCLPMPARVELNHYIPHFNYSEVGNRFSKDENQLGDARGEWQVLSSRAAEGRTAPINK